MASPKIVVMGAGSYFFARPVIWNIAHSEVMKGGTLSLVDTKPDVLKTVKDLAEKVFDAKNCPAKVEATTERRDALKGADFVVYTFSHKNAYYRGVDTEVSLKYGVRMCSSDTIGPGGIFRALREIPTALAIAKDVADLAPNAWIINLVNPTSVIGIALMRHSEVRSLALCDGLHEPHYRLRILKKAGILDDKAEAVPPEVEQKLDLRIAGVNHFAWMTRFTYDGRDMMPAWHEKLREEAKKEREEDGGTAARLGSHTYSKAKYNASYGADLMDIFGAYAYAIGHTKEYLPYYQGYGVTPNEPEPITVFDSKDREKKMAERWQETEDYANGKKPVSEFIETGKADHATDIIESMWGGLGKPFFVNAANRGAVSNMADDAFLELRSDLDLRGPRPHPVGEMPRGLLGLQQQVLDTHELTAEAAVTCDRGILLRAFMTDPIINNIGDAKKIIEELLEREKDDLPDSWQK